MIRTFSPSKCIRRLKPRATVRFRHRIRAIVVSWSESPSPPGATPGGYRVYRGELESGRSRTAGHFASEAEKSLGIGGAVLIASFSDTDFEFGKAYLYTVRSVAQFGEDPVESADSAPAVVTPRDVFPPATPGGLEIAVLPATPQAPAYVELSWAISPEGDLAGYYVYRSDAAKTHRGNE